ncbi:hypothetical protein [Fortiea contorta]|uniref:hypothetical protein n=1 Tax=Fortiea contorta TaxID=1892405 RepID=UPI0003477F7A|nr:hypothetical protein [Fortiea contorta]
MPHSSAIASILSGLITIILTYHKPSAYWNNASRKFFRPLIGDRATALLHYAIGAGLIAIGIILLDAS